MAHTNKENLPPITKELLIDNMAKQYHRQVEACEMKWTAAMGIEENSEKDHAGNKRTKKENTDLKEYNQQVDALGRTSSTILKIIKSDELVSNEEEDGSDDLV